MAEAARSKRLWRGLAPGPAGLRPRGWAPSPQPGPHLGAPCSLPVKTATDELVRGLNPRWGHLQLQRPTLWLQLLGGGARQACCPPESPSLNDEPLPREASDQGWGRVGGERGRGGPKRSCLEVRDQAAPSSASQRLPGDGNRWVVWDLTHRPGWTSSGGRGFGRRWLVTHFSPPQPTPTATPGEKNRSMKARTHCAEGRGRGLSHPRRPGPSRATR